MPWVHLLTLIASSYYYPLADCRIAREGRALAVTWPHGSDYRVGGYGAGQGCAFLIIELPLSGNTPRTVTMN